MWSGVGLEGFLGPESLRTAGLGKPRAPPSVPPAALPPTGKLGIRAACQAPGHFESSFSLYHCPPLPPAPCLWSSRASQELSSQAQQQSGSSPEETGGRRPQLDRKAGFPEKPWSRDMLAFVIMNSLNPDISAMRCGHCADGAPEARRNWHLLRTVRET